MGATGAFVGRILTLRAAPEDGTTPGRDNVIPSKGLFIEVAIEETIVEQFMPLNVEPKRWSVGTHARVWSDELDGCFGRRAEVGDLIFLFPALDSPQLLGPDGEFAVAAAWSPHFLCLRPTDTRVHVESSNSLRGIAERGDIDVGTFKQGLKNLMAQYARSDLTSEREKWSAVTDQCSSVRCDSKSTCFFGVGCWEPQYQGRSGERRSGRKTDGTPLPVLGAAEATP